jgi:uncharacterized protein
MKVEVCYAVASGATRIAVVLEEDATLGDALVLSGIESRLSLNRADLSFAIFGRRATLETIVRDGDRVELLRPLVVDPKEARHRRVAKKRALRATKPMG